MSSDPKWKPVHVHDAARWGEIVVSHGPTVRETVLPGDHVRVIFLREHSPSERLCAHAWVFVEVRETVGGELVSYRGTVVELIGTAPTGLLPGPHVEFRPHHVADIRRGDQHGGF